MGFIEISSLKASHHPTKQSPDVTIFVKRDAEVCEIRRQILVTFISDSNARKIVPQLRLAGDWNTPPFWCEDAKTTSVLPSFHKTSGLFSFCFT